MFETAFSLWMLYDASQRRVPGWWYFVILMPFGEWAYFFIVYLQRDTKIRNTVRKLGTRAASVEELQEAVDALPSLANKIRLAQGLHDFGRMEEASEHFRHVIAKDDENKEAYYGLALSCMGAGDAAGALEALETLVAVDIAYKDFAPGAELAALLWRQGRRDEALATMKRVSRRSQRFKHEVQYAMFLIESDCGEEAAALLEAGLSQHDSGPRFAQRQDAVWAKRARALLERCPPPSDA